MNEFIVAFGLALAIEGFIYAAFPDAMMRVLELVRRQPISSLRVSGVIVFAAGVFIVWLARM